MQISLRHLIVICAVGFSACELNAPASNASSPIPNSGSGTQAPEGTNVDVFNAGIQYNGAVAFKKAVTP